MMEKLKFNQDGLIPAIVQDHYTKEVLTLAYMNKESLKVSISEKQTCFYSRSRQKLWRKGEESGNFQHIVSIKPDCDGDALLIEVVKDGPACHLGTESCFQPSIFETELGTEFSFEALYELIAERKANKKDGSYTNYLFDKGLDKILKKVGEEATEVVIAAKDRDFKELRYEIADLAYHLLVLMVEQDMKIADIKEELAGRYAPKK
ncbi:MAG: bifunctional phosphoribosyl-AMP cyclohydrolase/phosphoribosyl-ATP diphosphatase HisIE [Bacillota bacterium]|nr:bifunctional phosphoribosyl-AMP cyclohydrolase/phosphoribosyl-ATP diphosphatase HisIE [Bacillota bacterium]HHU60361.1 bifunctional phosphoribosyl-AMP cyclohydrolase/phosphoribosyl-ATP diphosphatase HisIE [Natronincola sp.]